MDEGAAMASQPHHRLKRLEVPYLILLAVATVAFLLKLPYLPTGLIAIDTGVLVMVGYGYLRIGYGISAPLWTLMLLSAAVAVDALGNYFHMYGREFGPVMFDEFSHCTASALVIPVIIWLLKEMIQRLGYQLPLGLVTLVAITCNFSAVAFYEIIELWDERYFGGKRIWSLYDTSNDLQWDLTGILTGAFLTVLALTFRAQHRRNSES
jgi:uncharacterized membrane protein YjdF